MGIAGYVPSVGERDLDKITRAVRNLYELLTTEPLTEDASPVVGTDWLFSYDVSANEIKKVHPSSIVTIAGASDYEEGSWTPVIKGLTTAGTNTYDIQVARYIKIGNFIWSSCRVRMTAKDAAMAGTIVIDGLPYTVSNVTNGQGAIAVSSFNNVNLSAGKTQLGGQTLVNTTQVALIEVGDNVAGANVVAAAIAADTQLIASVSYRTG